MKITKINIIIGVVLIINIFGFYMLVSSYVKSNKDLKNAQHNIEALKGEINVTKDKLGREVYEKTIFISKAKDLEKLNKDLSDSYKTLKTKYDIIAGGQTSIVIRDTISLKDSILIPIGYIGDTLFKSSFKDSILDGVLKLRLNSNTSNIGFYLDEFNYIVNVPRLDVFFTKTGEMIVRTLNPNVRITNITGFIDPYIVDRMRKKRWSIGLQTGFGLMIGKTLIEPKEINISVGPYIGLGLNYNIFSW